jgi:hypothetical protein
MSIKIENNCLEFINKINNAIDSGMQEAGISGVATIQNRTPVKTGNTKRATTFTRLKGASKFTITFGIDKSIVYAEKTEFVGKSKGYFRSSLQDFSPEALEILKKHLINLGK